jgi:hypothetical protein
LDTRPANCVVGFGDIVEDGIAGFVVHFSVFVAGEHRVNGFVDIFARKESKLCPVYDIMSQESRGEAMGENIVEKAVDSRADRDGAEKSGVSSLAFGFGDATNDAEFFGIWYIARA